VEVQLTQPEADAQHQKLVAHDAHAGSYGVAAAERLAVRRGRAAWEPARFPRESTTRTAGQRGL
jgi:hypothetical protein